jgi:uncharacterized membrane protein
MRITTVRRYRPILMFVLVLAILPTLIFAQQEGRNDRGRGIAIYTEYSGISVVRGDILKMELLVANKGTSGETIDVKAVSVPKGWKAIIRGGPYDVSGVYVGAGDTKRLQLTLEADGTAAIGDYVFSFLGRAKDGAVTASYDLTVKLVERSAIGEDIEAKAAYPVLRGQADTEFEFSMEMKNKGHNDRNVNLAYIAPEKWTVRFEPAGETKQVTAFLMKGGQTETVRIDVVPAGETPAGEYPVLVRVLSGDRKIDVKLTVVVTGVYRIDAAPTSGLLSIDAMPDRASTFTLFVKNTGSAVSQSATFNVLKPENWTVTFKPEELRDIKPGETKQVEVTVKPDPRALVGDYAVNIRIVGQYAVKSVEMRVIVKAPTTWGWIGIGLILLVIAGLSILFLRMGRR